MKAKIAAILIISAIMLSFGAAKIGRTSGPVKKAELSTTATRTAEPIGGFVSEEH